MAKLIKYGFIHDKTQANAFLKSSGIKAVPDAGEDMFYFQFDGAIDGQVCIDVEIEGHTYSMTGKLGTKAHGCYGCIGTSKDKTSFDFVDKKPVAEASEPWPTIKETATPATMTVSTFTGGIETYPSQLTQVVGLNDKPIKGISLSLDTKNNIEQEIKENKMDKDTVLKGCPFDSMTQKAVHGKKIVLLITNSQGDDLLAISGQQGLTFTVEMETSDTQTKDSGGSWGVVFPGVKSWNCDVDGLYIFDDKARKTMVSAMAKDEYVCVELASQEPDGNGIKYVPIRKGLALVTSDELDAPNDDNFTASSSFTGSGELWMSETHTQEEIEAMTVTTKTD